MATPPCRELQRFVRCYAQRDMSCGEDGYQQSVIASLESILSFNFYERETIDYGNGERKVVSPIQAVGLQTQTRYTAYFHGTVSAFGIFLKPLALWQLFNIPNDMLLNSDAAGGDLLGRAIEDLWSRLAESRSFTERVQVAEGYLLPFAAAATSTTPIMRSAHHLFLNKGAIRIDALAHASALSLRQYERRFRAEVGMTPKLFGRITRFQNAIDLKRFKPERSWLTIAHELRYFDQAHMADDFKNLGGHAPTRLMERSGDLQPWSASNMSPNDVGD